MAYYNHLGFNQPDYHDVNETATVSIRKCNPEIEAYLKAQYGDNLPADVEFWEKLPTANDSRYWIDALSEQVMKEDTDEFGYGDPSVGQYYITDKDPVLDTKTIEALAAYAHEAWAGWMRYLWRLSTTNDDGTVTIPASLVERWQRQTKTEYADLPENEKTSDRDEAMKMLDIMFPQPANLPF